MEEDAGKRIEAKLDVIIRLLATPLVEDKTLSQKAELLAQIGLDNNQIAAICDTTPDTIRATRSKARRQRKSGQQSRSSKRAQARESAT